MTEEKTLLSIAMTYIHHGIMKEAELEGLKSLLKDSTDRRAIQVFNNGTWYDTKKDYFLEREQVIEMKEIKVFVGKNDSVMVDLDNLLGLEIDTIDRITYSVAKRYEMLIDAIEVAVEDCTGNAVNIVDEYSYKLAIADLVNIISNDKKEETIMETTNVVVENVTVVEENNTNKEEVVMNKNMEAAVNEMVDKFENFADAACETVEAAKETVKVVAGETMEEFAERGDEAVNTIYGVLGRVVNYIDKFLGCSIMKDAILEIWETGGSLKDKATATETIIRREIDNLEYWGDRESLKKAVQLKALVGDSRGKSIFEAIASGCIWVGQKVARKVSGWFKVDEKKSILNSIKAGIKTFASVLRKGASFVWKPVKFVINYTIATVVTAVGYVFKGIKTVFTKMKDWVTKKLHKFEDFEEEFEDDSEEFIEENDLA